MGFMDLSPLNLLEFVVDLLQTTLCLIVFLIVAFLLINRRKK